MWGRVQQTYRDEMNAVKKNVKIWPIFIYVSFFCSLSLTALLFLSVLKLISNNNNRNNKNSLVYYVYTRLYVDLVAFQVTFIPAR